MPTVHMKLYPIAGGTPTEAIHDACRVAGRLGVWVILDVNGIETMIGPEDQARQIIYNWQRAQERGATFVSANAVPDPRPAT